MKVLIKSNIDKPISEKLIERKLRDGVKALGGIALKFTSPYHRGIPDRVVLMPAEDIHHLTSFMSTDDPQQRLYLAYDFDNLMSLCKRCHQAIHNKRNI